MGPGQSGTWDKVPAPTDTANATSGNSNKGSSGKKGPYAGVGSVGNKEPVNYDDKMAPHVSAQSVQPIGNGNVKKTGYETPKADVRFTEGMNNMENMTDSMGK